MIEWVEVIENATPHWISTYGSVSPQGVVFVAHVFHNEKCHEWIGTFKTPEEAMRQIETCTIDRAKRIVEAFDLVIIPDTHKQWLNLPVVEDGRCSKKCMYSYPCCDSGGREYFGCRYKRKKHTGNSPHPDCIAACASK
jgi:hypothetical protein